MYETQILFCVLYICIYLSLNVFPVIIDIKHIFLYQADKILNENDKPLILHMRQRYVIIIFFHIFILAFLFYKIINLRWSQ